MKGHRIKFWGTNDMSIGWFICGMEEFYRNWDENTVNPDINTILKMFNIKKFLKAGIKYEYTGMLNTDEIDARSKMIPRILGLFCGNLSDENIVGIYETIDHLYLDDFWELLCEYKVYKHVNPKTIDTILQKDEDAVWNILHHRELSLQYEKIIANHLETNPQTAEWLIDCFLRAGNESRLFFPNAFTQEMRTKALTGYIDSDFCNINYLLLLEQSQGVEGFPLSDKLRYRSKKKREILQERLFAANPGKKYGAEVSFCSIPDGTVTQTLCDGIIKCVYSKEWIEENQDYPTILNNFIYLFGFVDRQFRSTFVSLRSQMSTLEYMWGIKGKKNYSTGMTFHSKRMLSILQMEAYYRELQRLHIRLEDVFKWFFEVYLENEFNANGFTFSPPSEGTTTLEKCKLLASAIDGVLKQYKQYCEDGYINRELLEMSSGHIAFESLEGCVKNRYAYSASKELDREMWLLFSDQSMMSYTRKTESKYSTVPDLLSKESIRLNDYLEHQLGDLEWLIKRGSVAVTENGVLKVNPERIFILRDLFKHEVICPHYFGGLLKKQIDTLAKAGEICYESTLFSKPEQSYLNYILNKSEYSNGLDLRNRYIHDTCTLEEKVQQCDYLEFQKIMVLIVLKINEELCIVTNRQGL